MANRMIENRPRRAGGTNDRHHDFDERALSRPVGAQQSKNLATVDLHRNPLQRMHAAAIDFGHVMQINGVIAGR